MHHNEHTTYKYVCSSSQFSPLGEQLWWGAPLHCSSEQLDLVVPHVPSSSVQRSAEEQFTFSGQVHVKSFSS